MFFFASVMIFVAATLALASCSPEKGDVPKGETSLEEAVEADGQASHQEPEAAPEPEPEPEPATTIDPSSLVPCTEFIEYSNKTVDPLKLVRCTDPDVMISCAVESLELSEVGPISADYILVKAGVPQESVSLSFTVRDTKAPRIALVHDSLTMDEGSTLDLRENVSSVTDPVDGDLGFVEAEPSKRTETGLQYEQGWYTLATNLDTSVPGTYYVKVIACDIHGTRTEKEFAVVVNEVEKPQDDAGAAAAEPQRTTRRYILNTNTRKFHNPGCRAVDQMAERNKQDTDEYTREEIIDMGYDPCGICHPYAGHPRAFRMVSR